jgi:N6-L-threonylcarbamoyladenine synthase
MVILGIETSCDETSVALVEGKREHVILKSNAVASSLAQHAKTGGVIPEVAARAQMKFMLPVLKEALEKAFGNLSQELTSKPPPIDAIAVTYGPGLIGPLLVGVETARTLSFVWNKPVVPVNHMMGHIYANFIRENSKIKTLNSKNPVPEFPLLALVVSGQHTDLLYMKRHGHYEVLGGTRDDAAGEAFDKIGRLLGLSYPAGAIIEKRSQNGDAKRFQFPRPLLNLKTHDFSFSGLKTAVLREVLTLGKAHTGENDNHSIHSQRMGSFANPRNDISLDEQTVNDIAAGTQSAILDILVGKTLRAAKDLHVKSILLSGGVAANGTLRNTFQSEIERQNIDVQFFVPPKNLCTDNAAMIASAGYFYYKPIAWKELTVSPDLYYE